MPNGLIDDASLRSHPEGLARALERWCRAPFSSPTPCSWTSLAVPVDLIRSSMRRALAPA